MNFRTRAIYGNLTVTKNNTIDIGPHGPDYLTWENQYRLASVSITARALLSLFFKGRHEYEIVHDAIPEDAIAQQLWFTPERQELTIQIHSMSFKPVDEGQTAPALVPSDVHHRPGKTLLQRCFAMMLEADGLIDHKPTGWEELYHDLEEYFS